jgi:hypothetical protein
VEFVLEIFLSAALDGTLVVWVEANSHACLATYAAAQISVTACAYCAAVGQEEIEELIGNGEMRRLLELLKCGEADEHLEER